MKPNYVKVIFRLLLLNLLYFHYLSTKLFLNQTKFVISNFNFNDKGVFLKFEKPDNIDNDLISTLIESIGEKKLEEQKKFNNSTINSELEDSVTLINQEDKSLDLIEKEAFYFKEKLKKYSEEDTLNEDNVYFLDFRLFDDCNISSGEIKVHSKESIGGLLLNEQSDFKLNNKNDSSNLNNIFNYNLESNSNSILSLYFDKDSINKGLNLKQNENLIKSLTENCKKRKSLINSFITDSSKLLKELSNEVFALKKLKYVIKNEETKIDDLNSDVKNFNQVLKEAEGLNEINETQFQTLKKLRKENLSFITKQQILIGLKQKEQDEVNKNLSVIEKKIENKNKLISEVKSRIDKQIHITQQNKAKTVIFNKIVLEIDDKISNHKNELSELENELKSYNSTNTKNLITISELKKQVTEIINKQNELDKMILNSELEREDKNKELSRQETELEQVKLEIQKLLVKKSKITSSIKFLYEEVEKSIESQQKLKEEKDMKTLDKSFVEVKIAKLVKENKNIENKTSLLISHLNEKKKKLNSLETEKIEYSTKLKAITSIDLVDSNSKLSKLEELHNMEIKAVNSLNEDKDELESNINMQTLEIRKLEYALKNSKDQLSSYELELTKLRSEKENSKEIKMFRENEFLKERNQEDSKLMNEEKSKLEKNNKLLTAIKNKYKSTKKNIVDVLSSIEKSIPSLNILIDTIIHKVKFDVSSSLNVSNATNAKSELQSKDKNNNDLKYNIPTNSTEKTELQQIEDLIKLIKVIPS